MDNLIDGLVRVNDRTSINPEFLSSIYIDGMPDGTYIVIFTMADGKRLGSNPFYTESEAICWLEDLKVEKST